MSTTLLAQSPTWPSASLMVDERYKPVPKEYYASPDYGYTHSSSHIERAQYGDSTRYHQDDQYEDAAAYKRGGKYEGRDPYRHDEYYTEEEARYGQADLEPSSIETPGVGYGGTGDYFSARRPSTRPTKNGYSSRKHSKHQDDTDAGLAYIGAGIAEMSIKSSYSSRMPDPVVYDEEDTTQTPREWSTTADGGYDDDGARYEDDTRYDDDGARYEDDTRYEDHVPFYGPYGPPADTAYEATGTTSMTEQEIEADISEEMEDLFAEAESEVVAQDWTRAIGARPAVAKSITSAVQTLRYSETINEKAVAAALAAYRKYQGSGSGKSYPSSGGGGGGGGRTSKSYSSSKSSHSSSARYRDQKDQKHVSRKYRDGDGRSRKKH